MSALTAFIEARLDEDEADALEAKQDLSGAWSYVDTPGGEHKAVDELGYAVAGFYDINSSPWFTGSHIARHDPARALREIAAKRAILAEYVRLDAAYRAFRHGANQAAFLAIEVAARNVASVYSDHPDYAEAIS